jgi:hypothetical protein
MSGVRSRSSCKPIFKALEILTVPLQYILPLMPFMVNNMEHVTFNFSMHSINTRNKLQLLRPVSIHTPFQKGVYYASITIFNKLPKCNINFIKDKKHFRLALKRFLIVQSFYLINEFLDYKDEIHIDGYCYKT